MKKQSTLQSVKTDIDPLILTIRGQRVMLDADLAFHYGVSTKVLLQAVKRNPMRFPSGFMFHLNLEEFDYLRSQIVTSKSGRGGRRYPPYVFTEQGVAMLSSVLRSERAVRVNIEIMRAFVRLRHVLISPEKIAEKLEELEKCVKVHDEQFEAIFKALHQLMESPAPKRRPIGFHVEDRFK